MKSRSLMKSDEGRKSCFYEARWRNGIRGSLKNYWSQGLESSSLSRATNLFGIIPCMPETLSTRENILDQRYDVIAVMGSSLERDLNGNLGFTAFSDFINGTASPINVDGDLKAQAIAQIFKSRMTPFVLVTGGIQEGVSRAEKLAEHAYANFGVPVDFMKVITSLPHSMGNIDAILSFIDENPDIIVNGKLGILTMSGHIRRTAEIAMEKTTKRGIIIKFLSTEVTLQAAKELSIDHTKQYYRTEEIRDRIISEDDGVNDLRNGIYFPRS